MKTRWMFFKHDVNMKLDDLAMWVARKLPARLRLWVIVDATLKAREIHPGEDDYAGPDGLGYKEICDGA